MVRTSGECISVVKVGVISCGATHIDSRLVRVADVLRASDRNAHGSKDGRVKRARSLMVRSARPDSKRAQARRFGVTRVVDQIVR